MRFPATTGLAFRQLQRLPLQRLGSVEAPERLRANRAREERPFGHQRPQDQRGAHLGGVFADHRQ